jgi:hypothetical protein
MLSTNSKIDNKSKNAPSRITNDYCDGDKSDWLLGSLMQIGRTKTLPNELLWKIRKLVARNPQVDTFDLAEYRMHNIVSVSSSMVVMWGLQGTISVNIDSGEIGVFDNVSGQNTKAAVSVSGSLVTITRNSLVVWDLKTTKRLYYKDFPEEIENMYALPGGQVCVYTKAVQPYYTCTIYVYNLQSKSVVFESVVPDIPKLVICDNYIVVLGRLSAILIDVSKKSRKTVDLPFAAVNYSAFPGGIIRFTDGDKVCVARILNGEITWLSDHEAVCYKDIAKFLPDGKRTVSYESTSVYIREFDSTKLMFDIETRDHIRRRTVIGISDGKIATHDGYYARIYNLENYKLLLKVKADALCSVDRGLVVINNGKLTVCST